MLDPEVAIDRINAVFGRHDRTRALHAKGRFYEGTFTASAQAAALCRAPHLQGEPVPVTVRWSNGGGNPRSDKAPDVRGMAVKFRTPAGDTDLLAQTAPRFPVRTPEAFVELTEAAPKPYLLPLFMARHPSSVPALLANLRARALVPPHSYAEATYYPIHAYGWLTGEGGGSRSWVRYVFRPLATAQERLAETFDGPDRLGEEMEARLGRGPVRFDLHAIVAGEGDDPHDPMSVWTRARELSAGTIEITAPIADPEAAGGVVVFDPVRVVDGIDLSDDPILRYRERAYAVSISRRSS
jgi:catalase